MALRPPTAAKAEDILDLAYDIRFPLVYFITYESYVYHDAFCEALE